MLLSIPSPHSGTISIGPLALHMYGLMLLLGIAACIWLTGRRWVARGGDWDLVFRVAVWGVGFGIVGARLYHDATSGTRCRRSTTGGRRSPSGAAVSASGAGSSSACSPAQWS